MRVIIWAAFVNLIVFARIGAAVDLVIAQPMNYQTPIHVDSVDVNRAAKLLTINGKLPNPCYAAPTASLTLDPRDPSTFILHVSSTTPTEACIEMRQGVEATLHLPTLIRASRLDVSRELAYVIRSESADLVMNVSGAELM